MLIALWIAAGIGITVLAWGLYEIIVNDVTIAG